MHLMPKEAGATARIVGFDPGTDTLGMAYIDFDVETLRIVETKAQLMVGSKMSVKPHLEEVHSARFARIEVLRYNIVQMLRHFEPQFVISEAPFFNRLQPSAFAPLVEALSMLRHAVHEYDKYTPLDTVDPPSVKKAVGAAWNAKKDAVKAAVVGLAELNYTGPIPLGLLDEHSIDAIAVAYSKLLQLRGNRS